MVSYNLTLFFSSSLFFFCPFSEGEIPWTEGLSICSERPHAQKILAQLTALHCHFKSLGALWTGDPTFHFSLGTSSWSIGTKCFLSCLRDTFHFGSTPPCQPLCRRGNTLRMLLLPCATSNLLLYLLLYMAADSLHLQVQPKGWLLKQVLVLLDYSGSSFHLLPYPAFQRHSLHPGSSPFFVSLLNITDSLLLCRQQQERQ